MAPNDFMNTIDINCFNSDDIDIDDEDLDIHTDSSQNNKKFDCPKCEYSCTYEDILIEHMECHTGKKPLVYVETGHQPNIVSSFFENKKDGKHIKCHICEFVSDNATSLKEHMVSHEQEILSCCTECNFTCRNEYFLNLHLASHTGVKDLFEIHGEGAISPKPVNDSMSTNNNKRGLSVSPEVLQNSKKTLPKKQSNKKRHKSK